MSLTTKTLGALRWSFLMTVGEQGTRLIVSLVIARLLLPSEYGLTAMIAVFVAFGQVLISSGFARAIVQRKDPTHVELCSVFYFNIAVAFCCAGLLTAAGPFIASFYQLPVLAPLAAVMSLDMVISSFGLVQNTLLTKKLDFKTQFWARFIGTMTSGAVGIGMALSGCGVWSLVGQCLTASTVSVAWLWLNPCWKPSWIFRLNALKPMFSFGSKLLVSALIEVFFNNIYVVVIGKVFSASELGFYTRAQQLQQLPVDNLCMMSDRVLFSSFSSIQHDREHLRRALRKSVMSMALVIFPAMLGLAIVAKPLVLVALTSKWSDCIPYLQLLCVVGAFYPLQMVNLSALTAQGRSDLFLRLEIIKKCILVAAVLLTWRWGVVAMIYGQMAVSFISFILNCFYSGRLLGYGLIAQVKDAAGYMVAALLMGAVLFAVQIPTWSSNLLLLVVQLAVGGLTYVALCRLFALSAFMELWQRLPQLLGAGRQSPAPAPGA